MYELPHFPSTTSDEPSIWSVHPVTDYSRPCYANSLPEIDYQRVSFGVNQYTPWQVRPLKICSETGIFSPCLDIPPYETRCPSGLHSDSKLMTRSTKNVYLLKQCRHCSCSRTAYAIERMLGWKVGLYICQDNRDGTEKLTCRNPVNSLLKERSSSRLYGKTCVPPIAVR